MRRRLSAILTLASLAMLLATFAAWLLSTRRFPPYVSCMLYDDQRTVPYRWLKATALPAGLVLRVDNLRDTRGAGPMKGWGWKSSFGEGRVFDQPTEWTHPELRRLGAPYRNYVTHRLLLPWWLLVSLLGAAPAYRTFVRLRRAHRADHGRCPACGADLRLVDGGRCAACGTVTAEIVA